MGGVVSTLAFPVPNRSYSEPMLKHQGDRLVWLMVTTENKKAVRNTRLKVPALHYQYPNAQFTVLYSHGNAEDLGINIPYLEQLSNTLQVNVLAYEYPGYSIAEGKEPSEVLCNDAIRAAYDYLTVSQQIDPTTIVLLGRALGTGPTVDLASQIPHIAGTILQSPLESGIRCVLGTCPSLVFYPWDIFRSYAKMESIAGPVLIVHGKMDRVIPCSNGKALQSLLEQRPHHDEVAYQPVWIDGRGHNNMPANHCLRSFQRFLLYLPSYQQTLRKRRKFQQELDVLKQNRMKSSSPSRSTDDTTHTTSNDSNTNTTPTTTMTRTTTTFTSMANQHSSSSGRTSKSLWDRQQEGNIFKAPLGRKWEINTNDKNNASFGDVSPVPKVAVSPWAAAAGAGAGADDHDSIVIPTTKNDPTSERTMQIATTSSRSSDTTTTASTTNNTIDRQLARMDSKAEPLWLGSNRTTTTTPTLPRFLV